MKENLNDLRAFILVARTGSFTKAAAQMGVSQSALSHSIRGVEERLKIKLFHRTTRSISTTEAGEQLYQRLSPLFDDIDKEVNELSTFRNAVSGSLRINGNEHVFRTVAYINQFTKRQKTCPPLHGMETAKDSIQQVLVIGPLFQVDQLFRQLFQYF